MPEKSCEAGNKPIASGYAMKARPGPDFTTSVTFIQFLFCFQQKNQGTPDCGYEPLVPNTGFEWRFETFV